MRRGTRRSAEEELRAREFRREVWRGLNSGARQPQEFEAGDGARAEGTTFVELAAPGSLGTILEIVSADGARLTVRLAPGGALRSVRGDRIVPPGRPVIQLTPQMRVLVAVEPADFRRGIDGLAALCRGALGADPFSGTVFVFCNRRRTAVKLLVYDGQGFWLCQKRLSKGRFHWWPSSQAEVASTTLAAHELQILLWAGDPSGVRAAPIWRQVKQSA